MRLAAILLVFLAPLMSGAASAEQTNSTPRVAIISAYQPEWIALRNAMSETHTQIIADTTYIVGKLEGKDVVLFLSGVSMVNAAMTTQGVIDHFKITRIVFSGIAGGTNPDLSAGDVVVADRWSEYLKSVFARKTTAGWSVPAWLGKTLPNYGMIFPHAAEIAHPGQSEPEKRFWFDVDSDHVGDGTFGGSEGRSEDLRQSRCLPRSQTPYPHWRCRRLRAGLCRQCRFPGLDIRYL